MAQQIVTPTFSKAGWSFFHRSASKLLLPPASLLSPSDVVFAWDPSHNPYRDTLNGIDLTPDSSPVVERAAGRMAVHFDGVDDALRGPVSVGTMSGDWTMYLVVAPGVAGSQYFMGLEDASSPANDVAGLGTNNTLGSFVLRREVSSSQGADFSGSGVASGVVELVSGAFTSSAIEAFTRGSTSGSTADAKVPAGIDQVSLGEVVGVFGRGHLFYALAVNAARSAEVASWIQGQFLVGASV